MSQFVIAPNAADDLNDIWLYLAEKGSEAVADSTLHQLIRAFRELAMVPGMGHRRVDLTSRPVHFYLVEPYLVVYGRNSSPLPIYAVLHGARDLRSILRHRPI